MFTCDRCNLRPGHQALRGDLRLLRCRAIATPGRSLNHLKPTDAARLRDVQLDVHFAVCNHTATRWSEVSFAPSCHAPHEGMSEALTYYRLYFAKRQRNIPDPAHGSFTFNCFQTNLT